MKNCIECGNVRIAKNGNIELLYSGKKVIITEVPMEYCPNCGEEYLHGTILAKIDQIKQFALCVVENTVTLNYTECSKLLEEICIA